MKDTRPSQAELSWVPSVLFFIFYKITEVKRAQLLFLPLQVVCHQMQRLHGENRAHGVCDARAGVRLPPELLLLLRVRPPAEERRRVCPEGRSAALQGRLRAGEGLTQLCQPR